MFKGEVSEAGFVNALEAAIHSRVKVAELVAADWPGQASELDGGALSVFWTEAVRYARWEIGRYARSHDQDEPVLADGYDAEGLVQGAFERLMSREAGGVPIFYSAEEIRRELRALIKHRVRWLHGRSETRLVVGEWDVMAHRGGRANRSTSSIIYRGA